jgi:hypothetical protein
MSKIISLFLLGIGLVISTVVSAQESIPAMEKNVGDAVGFRRLELLDELTTYYINVDNRKARKYGRQANLMADNLIKSNSILFTYLIY